MQCIKCKTPITPEEVIDGTVTEDGLLRIDCRHCGEQVDIPLDLSGPPANVGGAPSSHEVSGKPGPDTSKAILDKVWDDSVKSDDANPSPDLDDTQEDKPTENEPTEGEDPTDPVQPRGGAVRDR